MSYILVMSYAFAGQSSPKMYQVVYTVSHVSILMNERQGKVKSCMAGTLIILSLVATEPIFNVSFGHSLIGCNKRYVQCFFFFQPNNKPIYFLFYYAQYNYIVVILYYLHFSILSKQTCDQFLGIDQPVENHQYVPVVVPVVSPKPILI